MLLIGCFLDCSSLRVRYKTNHPLCSVLMQSSINESVSKSQQSVVCSMMHLPLLRITDILLSH